MPKVWKLRPVEDQLAKEVASLSGMPLPLARVLTLRGIGQEDQLESFLNPRLANLTDPFLLPDMENAVARVWKAIGAGERITVFGDYDVDGVTSAALLTRVLCELGARVEAFIPDRIDEGYGLSQEALERCMEEHGSTLVISVDCGVNSVDSVAYAQANGVDVIVTDHHEPDEETAPAFALVNPKLGEHAELKTLSGVGVAFKFSHALLKYGRGAKKPEVDQVDLRNYLDIVALGTVADMVPLTGENRIFVRCGLEALNSTKWEGMKALKGVAGIRGPAETFHLGFQLGPRINAAGRIGQPMQALHLLTTNDPGEAREIARLLDQTNLERRKLEKVLAKKAFAEIDAYYDPEKHYGLVVAQEGAHPGVVGIVASRVARHYNRPAIVMGVDPDGTARGSCRSIDEFDVLAGLRSCDQWLQKYGGHKMAAGLELSSDSLDAFHVAFNTTAADALKNVDLSPAQYIDAEVLPGQLDWSFYRDLKRLQPFGQNNPEPIWALRGVEVSGAPRVVGKDHLKLTLTIAEHSFEAIAFNYPLNELPEGYLDVAFALKENSWNGASTLQLQIKDIRPAE
jgi:single-stranded-DNA-specific exonuclease